MQPNSTEFQRCVAAAHKFRGLRPFNRPLGGEDIGDPTRSRNQARYFHCVFALSSDLCAETWAGTEHERFARSDVEQSRNVDLVHVLDRGLINIRERKALHENRETGQAFLNFYFSILNFVDRKNGRRGPTPYASYAAKMGGKWISV